MRGIDDINEDALDELVARTFQFDAPRTGQQGGLVDMLRRRRSGLSVKPPVRFTPRRPRLPSLRVGSQLEQGPTDLPTDFGF